MADKSDSGLLYEMRHVDHKRRYDQCVGVVAAAQGFFFKERQVQQRLKALDTPMSQYGGVALFVFGIALDWFLREGTGFQITFGAVVMLWGAVLWCNRTFSIYRGTRDLHGYRDKLTMLLSAWVGAGASGTDFWSMRQFVTGDDFDQNSPTYGEWWHGWSRHLEHHCDVAIE